MSAPSCCANSRSGQRCVILAVNTLKWVLKTKRTPGAHRCALRSLYCDPADGYTWPRDTDRAREKSPVATFRDPAGNVIGIWHHGPR